jgi:hypothetical protein
MKLALAAPAMLLLFYAFSGGIANVRVARRHDHVRSKVDEQDIRRRPASLSLTFRKTRTPQAS